MLLTVRVARVFPKGETWNSKRVGEANEWTAHCHGFGALILQPANNTNEAMYNGMRKHSKDILPLAYFFPSLLVYRFLLCRILGEIMLWMVEKRRNYYFILNVL